MRIREIYIGISTLFMSVAVCWLSWRGFLELGASKYARLPALIFFASLVVGFLVKLFAALFCRGLSTAKAVRDWLREAAKWMKSGFPRFVLLYVALWFAVCFAWGTYDAVHTVRENVRIASDVESAVSEKTAEILMRSKELAAELESVKTQFEAVKAAKERLEQQVSMLASENSRLQATVKKAAQAGFTMSRR